MADQVSTPSLSALIPTNLLSYVTGVISRLRLPGMIQRVANALFVAIFNINMEEAERPLFAYGSIEDIFTRRLKPGRRNVKGMICSPSDGFLARSEKIVEGKLIQAKGHYYDAAELVGRRELTSAEAAWFTTIYLAPHNYHRVHSPVSGRLEDITYIPGELWPVNKPFVKNMPRLFARNERVVFRIFTPEGSVVHAVMVGALNVGRIDVAALPGFITNDVKRQFPGMVKTQVRKVGKPINSGDELGTFMLGSTVVLVFDAKIAQSYRLVQTEANAPILMGQSLLQE